jgi:sulfate adenylyltransferase subunit 2
MCATGRGKGQRPGEFRDPERIVVETAQARFTERGATRMDDQTSDASMERRKKEGYF